MGSMDCLLQAQHTTKGRNNGLGFGHCHQFIFKAWGFSSNSRGLKSLLKYLCLLKRGLGHGQQTNGSCIAVSTQNTARKECMLI